MQWSRSWRAVYRAFGGIEPAPERDKQIDQRRDHDRGKRELGNDLPLHQRAKVEHAVKADGDEDQRIDDLAQQTGQPCADPEQPPLAPGGKAGKDIDIKRLRRAVRAKSGKLHPRALAQQMGKGGLIGPERRGRHGMDDDHQQHHGYNQGHKTKANQSVGRCRAMQLRRRAGQNHQYQESENPALHRQIAKDRPCAKIRDLRAQHTRQHAKPALKQRACEK
ncbi:hypothetical protein E4T56_gene15859 [Termitomyces sp. T112]|nr:hypothetical protein E4T56_gene15859 [Termitomyces sp. T112]